MKKSSAVAASVVAVDLRATVPPSVVAVAGPATIARIARALRDDAHAAITVNGSTVNYLTSFAFNGAQFYAVDNIYAATTYAEIQAEATALGITNLPADPQAGH